MGDPVTGTSAPAAAPAAEAAAAPTNGAPVTAAVGEGSQAAAPAAPTPPGSLVGDAKAPAAGDGSQSGDGAPAGEGADGDAAKEAKDGKEGGDAKKPGEADAPVEYKDFTFPEGMQPDDKLLTGFKTAAAEAGLTQESAQKLVDLHGNALREASNASTQFWYDTQRQWQEQVKADPEIGGKNFQATSETIGKLIDSVGGEDSLAIRQAFELTGAGNHPAVVKLLYRLGKSVAEGSQTKVGKPAGSEQPVSSASKLYPTLPNTNQ